MPGGFFFTDAADFSAEAVASAAVGAPANSMQASNIGLQNEWILILFTFFSLFLSAGTATPVFAALTNARKRQCSSGSP